MAINESKKWFIPSIFWLGIFWTTLLIGALIQQFNCFHFLVRQQIQEPVFYLKACLKMQFKDVVAFANYEYGAEVCVVVVFSAIMNTFDIFQFEDEAPLMMIHKV